MQMTCEDATLIMTDTGGADEFEGNVDSHNFVMSLFFFLFDNHFLTHFMKKLVGVTCVP